MTDIGNISVEVERNVWTYPHLREVIGMYRVKNPLSGEWSNWHVHRVSEGG